MKNGLDRILGDLPQWFCLFLISNQLNSGMWSISLFPSPGFFGQLFLLSLARKSGAGGESSGKCVFAYFTEDTLKSSRLRSLHRIKWKRKNQLEKARLVHHNPGVRLYSYTDAGDPITEKPTVLPLTLKQLSWKLEHYLTLDKKITQIDQTYAHVSCMAD